MLVKLTKQKIYIIETLSKRTFKHTYLQNIDVPFAVDIH